MTRMIFALLLAALPYSTFAQTAYPNRPVHLVVGFPAGGGADVEARAVAAKMEQFLGQPIVIENRAGASGNIGAAGDGVVWEGPWSAATAYSVNDAVNYTLSGVTTSYICTTAVGPSATPPPSDSAHWDILTSPGGETPTYASALIVGTGGTAPTAPYTALDASYTPGSTDGDYTGGGIAGNNVSASMTEVKVYNTAGSPNGLAFVRASRRNVFAGTVTTYLPQIANGAALNWSTSNVMCQVTVDSEGTESGKDMPNVSAVGGNAYRIIVDSTTPRKVTTTLFGFDALT